MRLPNQVQSVSKNAGYALHGVNPSVDYWCILKCGATAIGCITCGTNLACWAKCAPGVIGCVTGCF